MDLKSIKKIYFIGIGGIGMSAVAGIAKSEGFEVSGSDASDIYEPSKGILDSYRIPYFVGYSADNFKNADLVVVTPAVDQSNPEVAKALDLKVPIVGFAELLGQLVKDKKRIVVVGTHGKGTTSGAIAYALKNFNDSGFFVGAVLNDLQTNFHHGDGPYFVMEGDEYKSGYNNNAAKFSYFKPNVLLINNIEFDHPDLYPTLEDFKKPFKALAESVPADGLIVYNADDSNVLDVIAEAEAKKVGFSMSKLNNTAEVRVAHRNVKEGYVNLDIEYHKETGTEECDVNTKFPGLPYSYDMLAAATVLYSLGYSNEQIFLSLKDYSGVKRRYEIVRDDSTLSVIDDYAHHPTAVKQTLEATREKYPDRRIVCFFEPHTYSRTKETLPELEQAFGSADLVYLAEVYPAREQKLPSSITGEEVVEHIIQYQPNAVYVKNKQDALDKYGKEIKAGDVVVVMAVGSFNTLVNDLQKLI